MRSRRGAHGPRGLMAGLAVVLALAGCQALRPSSGGARADVAGPRRLDPGHVAVPAGYAVSVVTGGLTFPTGVAFDDAGVPHVVEAGYSYGEVFTTPRLLRIEPDGRHTSVTWRRRPGSSPDPSASRWCAWT